MQLFFIFPVFFIFFTGFAFFCMNSFCNEICFQENYIVICCSNLQVAFSLFPSIIISLMLLKYSVLVITYYETDFSFPCFLADSPLHLRLPALDKLIVCFFLLFLTVIPSFCYSFFVDLYCCFYFCIEIS